MQSDGGALTLGGLVSLVRGNTYKSALLGQPGPVLLGLASIQRDGGFRGDSLKTYGGESADKLLLRPGDLYVSLKDVTQSGDLLGAVARLPKSIVVGRLTQDTVKLVFDSSHYPPVLLYWVLRAPEYRAYCRERAIGTTNLSLSRDDFLAFPLPASTKARMELVKLLETIEARIEVLRQTSATLESIAQALFKSWFVDFDPVRAKAEGREPEGMDAAMAALFPAELQDSELGPIPKGWSVQPIGDLVEAVGGSTPDTKNAAFWKPAVHYWTSPKDLSGATAPVLLGTERKVSDAGIAKISSGLLPVGTLLMSSRAPIGYLSLAQVPVAINQGYIAMRPGGRLPPAYLYFWCQLNMDVIKGRANGSTFMEISKKVFRPIPAVLPSPEVIARFLDFAVTLFDRVTANERQALTLVAHRDVLLPRLISGKVRIQDALTQTEEVMT